MGNIDTRGLSYAENVYGLELRIQIVLGTNRYAGV
jgi:hypothetical protein